MTQEPQGRIKDIRVYRDSFIGMSMLACVPFLIFGALEVYGWFAAIGMFVLWMVLTIMGAASFVPHPRRVIVFALVAWASWTGVVLLTR